jgi:hypothetical protein
MPTTVIEWRVYCTTDSKWTSGWLNETDGPPTECFENNTHTVNESSVQELDRITDVIETSITSTNNSIITTLAQDAVFTGTGEIVSKYTSTSIFIDTDQASAADGLQIQFSADDTIWRTVQKRTVPIGGTHLTVTVAGKYFRIVYTNGGTAQAELNIQCKLNTFNASEAPNVGIDETIDNVTNIPITRSILTGKTQGGQYRNVAITNQNHLEAEIRGPATATGELAVSEYIPQVAISFMYSINRYMVNDTGTGDYSITQTDSSANLQVSDTNSSATIKSRRIAKYYIGQGLVIRAATMFNTPTTGLVQQVGFSDGIGGVTIGTNGTNFCICMKKGGVSTFINQDAFNVDKLDGTGASGMTIDPTKGNLYQIQFLWQGYGNMKFYVYEPETGKFVLYHNLHYANTNTEVTVGNPIFPLYMSIANTSNAGEANLRCTSIVAFNEGQIHRKGPIHFIDKTTSGMTTTNAHLLTLRNKTTYNGYTNSSQVYILDIDVANDHTNHGTVLVYKNCVLSDATWEDYDTDDSIVEYTNSATIDTFGEKYIGQIIGTYESKSLSSQSYEIYLAPGESLTIVGRENIGIDGIMTVGMNWQEDL